MFKVLAVNDMEGLEVFVCTGAYVDPENPCCIIITTYLENVTIRIQCKSLEESESFMSLLFECDKINLYEIANDNPEISVFTEPVGDPDYSDYMSDIESALGNVLESYIDSEEDTDD